MSLRISSIFGRSSPSQFITGIPSGLQTFQPVKPVPPISARPSYAAPYGLSASRVSATMSMAPRVHSSPAVLKQASVPTHALNQQPGWRPLPPPVRTYSHQPARMPAPSPVRPATSLKQIAKIARVAALKKPLNEQNDPRKDQRKDQQEGVLNAHDMAPPQFQRRTGGLPPLGHTEPRKEMQGYQQQLKAVNRLLQQHTSGRA